MYLEVKEKSEETHRRRSTSYPCCISTLGEFRRSWPYVPHRSQK